MSIKEARATFTSLAEALAEDREPLMITRNGRPILAVMPWSLWESFAETLDIMTDEEAMTRIRRALRNVEEGNVLDLDDVEALIRADNEGSSAKAG